MMRLCSCCCHSGMLLRYFVNLYDMEIIEEEAFLAWKEDVTQEFPGKGKSLFQVRGVSTDNDASKCKPTSV